jgi:hypothetical protein
LWDGFEEFELFEEFEGLQSYNNSTPVIIDANYKKEVSNY